MKHILFCICLILTYIASEHITQADNRVFLVTDDAGATTDLRKTEIGKSLVSRLQSILGFLGADRTSVSIQGGMERPEDYNVTGRSMIPACGSSSTCLYIQIEESDNHLPIYYSIDAKNWQPIIASPKDGLERIAASLIAAIFHFPAAPGGIGACRLVPRSTTDPAIYPICEGIPAADSWPEYTFLEIPADCWTKVQNWFGPEGAATTIGGIGGGPRRTVSETHSIRQALMLTGSLSSIEFSLERLQAGQILSTTLAISFGSLMHECSYVFRNSDPRALVTALKYSTIGRLVLASSVCSDPVNKNLMNLALAEPDPNQPGAYILECKNGQLSVSEDVTKFNTNVGVQFADYPPPEEPCLRLGAMNGVQGLMTFRKTGDRFLLSMVRISLPAILVDRIGAQRISARLETDQCKTMDGGHLIECVPSQGKVYPVDAPPSPKVDIGMPVCRTHESIATSP